MNKITRTDLIAQQLRDKGLDVKVTDQITLEADGEIEITGTGFSVQVGQTYLCLVEDQGDGTMWFGDVRRSVEQVYRDMVCLGKLDEILAPSKVKA